MRAIAATSAASMLESRRARVASRRSGDETDRAPERTPEPAARRTRGVASALAAALSSGMRTPDLPRIRATTILAVRRDGKVAIGGDGQVTRRRDGHEVERAEGARAAAAARCSPASPAPPPTRSRCSRSSRRSSSAIPGNLPRAAVELAKDWRSDRVLRRLEALLIVADKEHGFIISGTGELIEPDDGILAIGSGGSYALAAARALLAQHAARARGRS